MRASSRPWRFVVIDDHDDLRTLLRQLLQDEMDFVGEADSGRAGVNLVHAERPDLVILDIGIRNTVEGLGAVRLATTNGLSERAVRLVDDLLAARERLVAATHASDLDLGVRVHVGRAGVRPAR